MKKIYNKIEIEIRTFTELEDVLTTSNNIDVEFGSEFDGDTTTIPGSWR